MTWLLPDSLLLEEQQKRKRKKEEKEEREDTNTGETVHGVAGVFRGRVARAGGLAAVACVWCVLVLWRQSSEEQDTTALEINLSIFHQIFRAANESVSRASCPTKPSSLRDLGSFALGEGKNAAK